MMYQFRIIIYTHSIQVNNLSVEVNGKRFEIKDFTNSGKGIYESKNYVYSTADFHILISSSTYVENYEVRLFDLRFGQIDRFTIIDSEPILRNLSTSAPSVRKLPDQPDFIGDTIMDTVKEDISESTTIDIFYATSRKIREGKIVSYGNERAEISYGVASVNVPVNRAAGEIPRPKFFFLEENPNKHMFIRAISNFETDEYFKKLSDRIFNSDDKEALVFIHGFNVNFNQAVLRTAQICVDIGFEGAPITYSWPSRGLPLLYNSDEDNITYATPHIIQFFKDIKEKTGLKKFNVIAHSMGNRGLVLAIEKLKNENFYDDDFVFNQIILAAPDIDAEIFVQQLAPQLVNRSKRVTLYASSKDKALFISKLKKGLRIPRAGDSEVSKYTPIRYFGIDTVDVSHLPTDNFWFNLGHSYFAETRDLIIDIHYLIKFNHAPKERNLVADSGGAPPFWKFRK